MISLKTDVIIIIANSNAIEFTLYTKFCHIFLEKHQVYMHIFFGISMMTSDKHFNQILKVIIKRIWYLFKYFKELQTTHVNIIVETLC